MESSLQLSGTGPHGRMRRSVNPPPNEPVGRRPILDRSGSPASR
jgi:hypothetical protein